MNTSTSTADWPDWLRRADTKDAVVTLSDGVVTWHSGTWRNGVWHTGTWRNGVWHNGVWHNGVWLGGEWLAKEARVTCMEETT